MPESGPSPGRGPSGRATFLLQILGATLLALAVAPRCAAAEARPRVVASFLPAYCAAVNVAGGHATVESLVSGGLEPHDYQLTPADAAKLARADLIVLNGLGMESWLAKTLHSLKADERGKVARLSDGLEEQLLDSEGKPCAHDHAHEDGHDHHHAPPNPHIWLDPQLMEHGVRGVVRAFIRIAPAKTAIWEANGEAYIAKLRALDREFAEAATTWKDRPFIAHHNAFPYLVKRYGLKQVGVLETSADAPPGPRDLAELHKTIRREKVVAIFAEVQSPSRLPERVAKDAGIRLGLLDTLETGEATAGAYEQGMRANLKAFQTHLR